VSVSLVQLRGDIAVGRVQLHVENASDETVTVAAASLLSPALAEAAAWDADDGTTLTPGRSVNLPVALPTVVCTDDAPAPEVRMRVGGEDTEITVAVPDELEVLDRLVAAACAREGVESIARIEAVGADAVGTALELEVAVTPTGAAGTVELVALRGTPLLRFTSGAQWPLDTTVSGESDPETLRVGLEPQRCDAHAIAEDKVGTRLTLTARDTEGDEVEYPLPISTELSSRLLSLIAQVCGITPG
jgi:hypothetical protein